MMITTAAVRRHRLFTGTSLANATLSSATAPNPPVTCATQLVMDSTKANHTAKPADPLRAGQEEVVAAWPARGRLSGRNVDYRS
jgi:hypothetical protein